MGERDYGPIPTSVRDIPEIEDLDDGPRAAFLSAFWCADYFGCFPRDPRAFARKTGWPTRPDPALASLDRYLSELEGLNLLESWVGSSDGRPVWVGHIVGYHGFAGLPRDRKDPDRRPKGGSEYPGPDPELAKKWERPEFPPETPGTTTTQSHSNPGQSHANPKPIPAGSRIGPAKSQTNPARSPLV